jgi:hypothetical protein
MRRRRESCVHERRETWVYTTIMIVQMCGCGRAGRPRLTSMAPYCESSSVRGMGVALTYKTLVLLQIFSRWVGTQQKQPGVTYYRATEVDHVQVKGRCRRPSPRSSRFKLTHLLHTEAVLLIHHHQAQVRERQLGRQ